MNCWDQTLRIWNSKTRLEVARLSHNSQVVGLAWLDNEAAVLSLGEDGVLGKWTRIGPQNHWQWGRVLNAGSEKCAPEDKVCLAYARDRIAVALPRSGVKVWIWCKGSWLAQRSIMRTNVTALKFIDDGDALLGGTREGVVWHCGVPNGMMKVYAFLQSSITSISINRTGMQALIAQAGGSACLVSLGVQDEKRVGQSFLETDVRDGTLGAIFTTQGKTVVFGTADGSLLVWDAQKGTILYGMDHPDQDDDLIQTVASWDGPQGSVVAGTRQGRLLWWPEPQGMFVKRSCSPSLTCWAAPGPSPTSRKRPKVK
ncbi:WD40-repeat-containing domain protein [Mycena vitilis]|nr:WD40-repeat-containing domain protein [Mycena vitilis]